jgi:hypothetical protein
MREPFDRTPEYKLLVAVLYLYLYLVLYGYHSTQPNWILDDERCVNHASPNGNQHTNKDFVNSQKSANEELTTRKNLQ